MTLWAVRPPTTATLLAVLILTLLVAQPADLSSLNVGTVIFGPMDALACCLDAERYATLVFRKILNDVVAVPLQHVKGDAYISAFVSFVHASARSTVNSGAPYPISRSFVAALLDTSGGYLRSYLLPVTREAFYAGNLRFTEVHKLFALYDDTKDYFHTTGQGWAAPQGKYGLRHNVRTLDITSATQEELCACDNFFFHATAWAADNTGEKSKCCAIPIPFFDDNSNPRSVALPLRYGSLHSIETPESAYILLGHYVRSIRCLQARAVSKTAFVDYNKHFRRWLIMDVLPRLSDERWYPAFGGILRVLKKTGEYIRGTSSSKDAKCNASIKTRRRRQEYNKSSEGPDDIIATHETDSIAEAVADDLVPIDVAVLQKLMHPDSEQDDVMKSDSMQIPLLPALRESTSKTKTNFDEAYGFETAELGGNSISSIIPYSDITENTNVGGDLHQRRAMIDNQTVSIALLPEINNVKNMGEDSNKYERLQHKGHKGRGRLSPTDLESSAMNRIPEKKISGYAAERFKWPLVIKMFPQSEKLLEVEKPVLHLTTPAMQRETLTNKYEKKYREKEKEILQKFRNENHKSGLDVENETQETFRKGKSRLKANFHSANLNPFPTERLTTQFDSKTKNNMAHETATKETISSESNANAETFLQVIERTSENAEVDIKSPQSVTNTMKIEKINTEDIKMPHTYAINQITNKVTIHPAMIPKRERSKDTISQSKNISPIVPLTAMSIIYSPTNTSLNNYFPLTSPSIRTKYVETLPLKEQEWTLSTTSRPNFPTGKLNTETTRVFMTPVTQTNRQEKYQTSHNTYLPRTTTMKSKITTTRTMTKVPSLANSEIHKPGGVKSDYEYVFQNLTDGCVQRVWDGFHAPAPLIAHFMADVLESPILNLDFHICHLLAALFIWFLLLCTSLGVPDCQLRWWNSCRCGDANDWVSAYDPSQQSDSYYEEDRNSYLQMGGDHRTSSPLEMSWLNQKKSLYPARTSNRRGVTHWKGATREERTPLNDFTTASSSTKSGPRPLRTKISESSVQTLDVGKQQVQHSPNGNSPMRCLYPVSEQFLRSDTEESVILDPEDQEVRSTRFSQ